MNHAIQRPAPPGARRGARAADRAARRQARAPCTDERRGASASTRRLATLERRLYLLESGPTGNGPASHVIANATGCSSVYASTLPFNPYLDPWVNSLFQDAQPSPRASSRASPPKASTTSGRCASPTRARRTPTTPRCTTGTSARSRGHEFTPQELALLPDGVHHRRRRRHLRHRLRRAVAPARRRARRSRCWCSTPGVYSNTGGQASTASLTGQDSDLTRFGSAHAGKQEDRKELGLLAAFHPNVFVVQTSTALQGHFLGNDGVPELPRRRRRCSTSTRPCQAEHGIADAAASRARAARGREPDEPGLRARPAPRRDAARAVLARRQPGARPDWTTTTLTYVEDGETQLLKCRSRRPISRARRRGSGSSSAGSPPAAEATSRVPIHEYVELPARGARGQACRSSGRPTTSRG